MDYHFSSNGSEAELRRVIRQFQGPLTRFVHFLVTNSDDIDDIVHDSFVKLWKEVTVKKKKIDNLKAFLFRVARNHAIDILRKDRVRRVFTSQESSATDSYTPLDALYSSETESILVKAMSQLSYNEREILALVYLEDLKMHEAAKVLNIGDEAVSSRLRRARASLKSKLPESFQF